jgi:hypothetical protein
MVDSRDHSVGVLIDLDIAVRIKDGDLPIKYPPILGGTLPFRAIDLLRDDPIPEVRYRYDLESFYYVLLWILTYYPAGFSERVTTFSHWSKGSWKHIQSMKLGYVISAHRLPRGPLLHSWLTPLAQMFRDGFLAEGLAIGLDELQSFDAETLGNHVTYDRFINILKSN